MEEDIVFLEKMIKEYRTFGDLDNPDYEDTDRIYKAIENLIKRYKDFVEIEKEHKKENGKLREEVKELETAYLLQKDRSIELATTIDALKTDYQEEKEKNKELEATLKQTQDSWYEDAKKIELNNECEIALNNRIIDLENQLQQEKEKDKELENEDLTTVYIKGVCDEKEKWKSLVKDKIEELENEKEQLRIEKNVIWDTGIYKIDLKITAYKELLGDDK